MRAGYHGQHSQVQHINRAEERGEDGPSREAGGAGLGTGRTLFPGSLAGDFDWVSVWWAVLSPGDGTKLVVSQVCWPPPHCQPPASQGSAFTLIRISSLAGVEIISSDWRIKSVSLCGGRGAWEYRYANSNSLRNIYLNWGQWAAGPARQVWWHLSGREPVSATRAISSSSSSSYCSSIARILIGSRSDIRGYQVSLFLKWWWIYWIRIR